MIFVLEKLHCLLECLQYLPYLNIYPLICTSIYVSIHTFSHVFLPFFYFYKVIQLYIQVNLYIMYIHNIIEFTLQNVITLVQIQKIMKCKQLKIM